MCSIAVRGVQVVRFASESSILRVYFRTTPVSVAAQGLTVVSLPGGTSRLGFARSARHRSSRAGELRTKPDRPQRRHRRARPQSWSA